ncbi:MAG: adenylate/guanylate cyclase domain-containing protein, partial [Thermodesulfobacteriota bacterium]|nr:adenylate/guanylate cyclase domain-containing protein [Thermodesulfobacteriota bacterium]
MKELLYSKKDTSRFLPPRPMDEYSENSIRKMAVLFTDIVGSTEYFKAHGDRAGREMLQRHQDIASNSIFEHSGFLVKTLGDSVLAYFLDPKEAVKSAIKIQQKSISYNKEKEPESRIHIKIGIHVGEGIVEEQDIFGNVVNLAAKIVPLAGSDQIYVSEEVYDMVRDLPYVRFKSVDVLGKKNLPKGLKIYKVIWDERTTFDPTTSVLLYLRPLWHLGNHNFIQAWNNLLKAKDNVWGGKIVKKTVLTDKSAVFILNEESLSTALARDVLAFLIKESGNEHGSALLPVQIIIDSGHYLRADKLIMEDLKVKWDEIDPGEIYISSSAYWFMKEKQFFSLDPPFDAKKPNPFYKLIHNGKHKKIRSPLFLYQ